MTSRLHLTISSPFTVIVDEADVVSLRAEDESGSFGLLPGHVDMLTVLPVSVVRWKTGAGETRYCALRGGVLSTTDGTEVAIACREGVIGTDLGALAGTVETLKAEQQDDERRVRTEEMRMHARAVRQIVGYLSPGGTAGAAYDDGAP